MLTKKSQLGECPSCRKARNMDENPQWSANPGCSNKNKGIKRKAEGEEGEERDWGENRRPQSYIGACFLR